MFLYILILLRGLSNTKSAINTSRGNGNRPVSLRLNFPLLNLQKKKNWWRFSAFFDWQIGYSKGDWNELDMQAWCHWGIARPYAKYYWQADKAGGFSHYCRRFDWLKAWYFAGAWGRCAGDFYREPFVMEFWYIKIHLLKAHLNKWL